MMDEFTLKANATKSQKQNSKIMHSKGVTRLSNWSKPTKI